MSRPSFPSIRTLVLAASSFSASPLAADLQGPVTVSPGDAVRPVQVETNCPTFSWSGVEGADNYQIAIYELSGDEGTLELDPSARIRDRILPGAATSWTPSGPDCLPDRRRFAWSIRVAGEEYGWSSPLQFSVNTAGRVQALREALRTVLGELVAAGMLSDRTATELQQELRQSTDTAHPIITESPAISQRAEAALDESAATPEAADKEALPTGNVFNLYGNTTDSAISLNPNDYWYGDSGSQISLYDDDGNETIVLDSQNGSSKEMGAWMNLYHMDGTTLQTGIMLSASSGSGGGAYINLMKHNGSTSIQLYADTGSGYSRITTDELEIKGGADIAERFQIQGDQPPKPGLVVVIDPTGNGDLKIASSAYERGVIGVISGAGGLRPGVHLGQRNTAAAGTYPVALSGRVYVWADASEHPIHPGDLLTTANRPGYAMRASDPKRAQGAVLGKAMTSLESGQGLVLTLVSLQ